MAMSNLNQSDQNQSGSAPDPEVRSKPERRGFTAEYKRRIMNAPRLQGSRSDRHPAAP